MNLLKLKNIKYFIYCNIFFLYKIKYYLNKNYFYNFLIKRKIQDFHYNRNNSQQNTFLKKKILLIAGNLKFGGAEEQLLKLYDNLKKKYKVYIYFIETEERNDEEIKKRVKNYKCKFLKIYKLSEKKILDKFHKNNPNVVMWLKKINFFNRQEFLIACYLLYLLKKEQPEIIHTYTETFSIIGAFCGLYLNLKKIIIHSDITPNKLLFYRPYFKESFKYFSKQKNIKIICNNNYEKKEFEKWLNIKRKIITVYNTYDFFKRNIKFKKPNHFLKNKKEIIFGTVIRLEHDKRPFYLINTFLELLKRRKNIKFYIIGNGALKDRINKFIAKKKLTNKIILLGNKLTPINYMYYFDYFLLLSRIEGMPNVISESISARTKVITNNVGGCEELIIKDKTGYILRGDSEIKNAIEIDEIICKNGSKKILITKKIRLFYKKFNSITINTQIAKIYEKK